MSLAVLPKRRVPTHRHIYLPEDRNDRRVLSTQRTGSPDIPYRIMDGTETKRGRVYNVTSDAGVKSKMTWEELDRLCRTPTPTPPPPPPATPYGDDAPLDGPFWILFNPYCDLPPRRRFRTEAEAAAVSKKMFDRHGDRFHVMECKGSYGVKKKVIEVSEEVFTLVGD